MARSAFLLLAVAGCGGDDDRRGETAQDAGRTDDSGTVEDAGDDRPCDLVLSVGVGGEPAPGGDVTLTTADGGSGREYEVAWMASGGTLSADTGASVVWTLPTDVAPDVAETFVATATATAAGCPDDVATAEVVLDWPLPLRTVVIYSTNAAAARSREVADHYAAFRGVPETHLCGVDAGGNIDVLAGSAWDDFTDAVLDCVAALGWHVHYLVPVWGVPYKVDRAVNFFGAGVGRPISLDSLLVYGASSDGLFASVENPLYQQGDSMTNEYDPYLPFGELRPGIDHDYFLVARIDGADPDAAKALVDRTAAADELARAGTLAGTVYVDGNRGLPHPDEGDFGSYEWGERNIAGVEVVFDDLGWYPIVANYDNAEFGTAPAPLEAPDALYYAGWYSFGNYNDVFTWNVGAIGGHLDSCSACNIRTERDWSAMALRRGITATFGAVSEPYVAGMPEYDQFFKYLTEGATFGEAAYESTVAGVWMMVWLGDPLYRPYP